MNIQLPAFPSPPSTNLVARALQPLADEARRNAITADSLPSILEGIAAMAALAPFDPNEALTSEPHNAPPVRYTILDNVLALTGQFVFSPASKPWPREAASFSTDLMPTNRMRRHDQRMTSEFLAASLTAAGANPWVMDGQPQKALPASLKSALRFNMHQLLNQFLDCPHAWSAQKLLDASVDGQPAWETLVKHNNAETLTLLVRQGARLPLNKAWEESLKRAELPMVEPMLLALGQALPPAVAKRIQTAWQDRLKNNDLTPEAIAKMIAVLSPDSPGLSQADAEIQLRLSTAWGSAPNGSSARAYDYCTDRGAAMLNERGTIAKGPMAGQWTVLASMVMARIRAANDRGAREWDVDRMVGPARSPVNVPNSVRESIGVEWKPGISLDGVLMLGLMGQARGDSTLTLQNMKKQTEDLEAVAQTFATAAGIEDIQAWCRASAPAAAEITIACLKMPASKAATALIQTWRRALAMDGELMEQVPEDLKLKLITALHSRFGLEQQETISQFETVAYAISDGANKQSLLVYQGLEKDPVRLGMALEIALACSTPAKKEELLKGLDRNQSHFSEAHLERIETWLESQAKLNPTFFNTVNAPVREIVLKGRLPEAVPAKAPKPRF